MSKIIIAGAGGNQVGVIKKARAMGLHAVAMDGNPDAPGLAAATAGEVANIVDPAEIERVARKHNADGIYPAAELAVEAAAAAAMELNLPGLAPEVAHRVRSKLAMREALAAVDMPNPAFRGVESLPEAEEAGRAIGTPFIVKPSDANASKGVQRVDDIEDLPLAFAKAKKFCRSGIVLLEDFLEGEEFCVDGLVFDGRYILGGITGKERSEPPFRYDTGIFMPPALDAATHEAIEDITAQALSAIGFTSGTTHVEVIITDDGPRIVEIAGRPGGGRIPTDLIPLAYGMDFMADSLRIALGEAPVEQRTCERGVALFWIPTRSGVVTGIEGLDEAAALPGVVEVVMSVKAGDVMQHIVDCVTRDKVGYVLATGPSAQDAVATAKRARGLVRVVTEPVTG